jgi:hypothetical protein
MTHLATENKGLFMSPRSLIKRGKLTLGKGDVWGNRNTGRVGTLPRKYPVAQTFDVHYNGRYGNNSSVVAWSADKLASK